MNGDGISDYVTSGLDGPEILFMNEFGEVDHVKPLEFHALPRATLGDVDGNGADDLVLGSSYKPDDYPTGALYVVLLEKDGSVKRTTIIASGLDGGPVITGRNAYFGSEVAAIGDLDANGFVDLAVNQANSNKVYTLFMDADGKVESFVENEGSRARTLRIGAGKPGRL